MIPKKIDLEKQKTTPDDTTADPFYNLSGEKETPETSDDECELYDSAMASFCPLGPFSPPLKDLALAHYLPKYDDGEFGFVREYVEENNILPDTMYNKKETYMEFFTRLFSEASMLLDISRSMSISKVIKALRKNSREQEQN